MHTIELNVRGEEDLYNPFTGQKMLSDDAKAYILERLKERELHDTVELRVLAAEPVDEERLRQAMSNWFAHEQQAIKKERKSNMIEQIVMFAIGLFFITLSLLLQDRVGAVWFTVLSTLGAFSTWEAASIWIVRNPKLRRRKVLNEKLAKGLRIVVETR